MQIAAKNIYGQCINQFVAKYTQAFISLETGHIDLWKDTEYIWKAW